MNPWEIDWNKSSSVATDEASPPWEKDWSGTSQTSEKVFSFAADAARSDADLKVRYKKGLVDEGTLADFSKFRSDFVKAKPGDELFDPVAQQKIVKQGDDSYTAPGWTPPPVSTEEQAVTMAAGLGLGPGMGAMKGAGLAMKAVSESRPVLRFLAGLGGGAAGGAGVGYVQNKTIEAISPDAAEAIAQTAKERPLETLVGSALGGNAPYQKILPKNSGTIVDDLINRAIGAGSGAGISVARGLLPGNQIDLKDVGEQALLGALFTDPTKLGEKSLGITTKLGNVKAKGKGDITTTNQVANDIALDQAPATDLSSLARQPDTMSQLMLAKAQADLPKAAGEPKPTMEGGLDLSKIFPDKPIELFKGDADALVSHATQEGAAPIEERASVLEGQMPFTPAHATVLADLIRMGVVEPMKVKTPEAKVDIGPRNAEVSTGTGKETPFEAKMIEEWKAKIAQEQAAKSAVEPVSSPSETKPVSEPLPEPQKAANPTETPSNEPSGAARYEAPETQIESGNGAKWGKKFGTQEAVDVLSEKARQANLEASGFIDLYNKGEKEASQKYGKAFSRGLFYQDAALGAQLEMEGKGVSGKAHNEPSVTEPELPFSIKNGKMVDSFDREIIRNPDTKRYELVKQVSSGLDPTQLPAAVKHLAGVAKEGLSKFGEVAKEGIERAAAERRGEPVGEVAPEPTVEFPKPGEGRAQSQAEKRAITDTGYVNKDKIGLKPTRDTITGKEIPENIEHNAKVLHEKMTKEAVDIDMPEPSKETVDEVARSPDAYKPFLTDIAARIPLVGKIPVVKEAASVIGWIAKGAKNKIGLLDENIRERSPRIFGSLHDKIFELNKTRFDWVNRAGELGKATRKYLNKEDFANFWSAALSGDRVRAEAVLNNNPNAKELNAALEAHQQVMRDAAEAAKSVGREVPEIDFYFPRGRPVDREGLLKTIGADGVSLYKDALKSAAQAKGKKPHELTEQEQDDVMNRFISGSIQNAGKPGWLKPRAIETITKDMLKFYEPGDVGTYDYLMSVSRDASNRAFFGKTSEGEKIDPLDPTSNLGRQINDEVKSGRMDDKDFGAVSKALQDYFNNSTKTDAEMTKLASSLRRLQTRLYLSDISTVLPQYGDILVSAYRFGAGTTKAFLTGVNGKKLKLSDIFVDEGSNQEAHDFRRAKDKPEGSILNPVTATKTAGYYTAKAYDLSMRKFLGKADEFNKGGMLNAAFKHASDVVNNPSSHEFQIMDKEYGQMFPEKWPEMLKSLRSPDFAQGKLDDNARLFLFNELMRMQPLDPAGRAQGYNQTGPWGKMLYTLRSYALTQVNVLRRDAYDNIKSGDPQKVKEGLGKLGLYLAYVTVGGIGMSYLRDKALNRTSDPSEYAIGGMLQLAMIPRFALFKLKEEGPLAAAYQTLLPGSGAVGDAWKDSQLALKYLNGAKDKSGRPLVADFEDLLKQSRLTQYAPGFGREAYWWFGRGAEREKKAEADRARGKSPQTTMDLIESMLSPPDLKTNRRN